MNNSTLSGLPDELLEAIVYYLPPQDTIAFSATCTRNNKVTYEPLVWRAHCMREYRYWEPRHEIKERLARPPGQAKWRQLYNERKKIDKAALDLFNALLQTQQHRIERMERVAKMGYDVKDLLVRQRDETPDDAEDVLARRYHANAILGQIHRSTALEKWMRLQKRQMVRLEEVLGAYDLFVLAGRKGDLSDIERELDSIADRIKARDPDFETLSVRKKAIQIARFLRSENLVGNPSEDDYHALRNNFISIALFDPPHTSLPLQSVAIYCAVARRLGVNAKPSNYPQHVHVVIEAPTDRSLDGAPRRVGRELDPEDPADVMHLDIWRSDEEVPRERLATRLRQMGAPVAQHNVHLSATTNMEMALRSGRNIMVSVQEARDRQRGTTRRPAYPDLESAWYAMLWSMMILGDNSTAATLHRRRQCLPYLIEHYQAHFPEDLGLLEDIVVPMFQGENEHDILSRIITTARLNDANKRAPSYRPSKAELRSYWIPGEPGVAYKIGTHFQHRRYGYQGMIVGWDTRCSAEPRWIEQMRVDELPRGREQPFYNIVYASPGEQAGVPPRRRRLVPVTYYHVIADPADDDPSADDKSVRYVAEENIRPLEETPKESLMALAGKYFKRWDASLGRFVSNIQDEYPDD